MLADLVLRRAGKKEQTPIRQSVLLRERKNLFGNVGQLSPLDPLLNEHYLVQLMQKPRIDLCKAMNLVDRVAVLQGVCDVRETLRVWPGKLSLKFPVRNALQAQRLNRL